MNSDHITSELILRNTVGVVVRILVFLSVAIGSLALGQGMVLFPMFLALAALSYLEYRVNKMLWMIVSSFEARISINKVVNEYEA